MKKIFKIFAAILMTASMFLPQHIAAQTPEKMSYQAVIRNSSDVLVTNTQIGMQISILQGSSSGTAVYVETQTPTTNVNGLVSIEIGAGTVVSGNFATINWANGPCFIQTETDIAGGTNYSITVTNQLLSVPYALHAKTAETVTGGVVETDPVFTAWDKKTGILITESQISDLGNYIETEIDPNFTAWDKKTGILITESQISDLGNYIETETDPVFKNSQAFKITSNDITKLSNLSGVNTGDQDLSALATKVALKDSIAQVRSEIPDTADGSETKIIATDPNIIITGNGTTADPYLVKTKTYKVGDFAFDGVVFWVDSTGQHGLVCYKKDLDSVRWNAGTNKNTFAKKRGINAGLTNTLLIIAAQGEGDGDTYAALKCYNYNDSNTWFLPSLEELRFMYKNKEIINTTIQAKGGDILKGYYWSSTELNQLDAWRVSFDSPAYSGDIKSSKYPCRMVKAF